MMDKVDWSVLAGILGLIAICFIGSYMMYSCEDSASMERMEGCRAPAFVQAVGSRDRTWFIYRCADGSLVKSSVLIKADGNASAH